MNVEHNLILELVKGCFTPNLTCFAPQDALEWCEWVSQSVGERASNGLADLTDITLLSDDTYWSLDCEDDKDDENNEDDKDALW